MRMHKSTRQIGLSALLASLTLTLVNAQEYRAHVWFEQQVPGCLYLDSTWCGNALDYIATDCERTYRACRAWLNFEITPHTSPDPFGRMRIFIWMDGRSGGVPQVPCSQFGDMCEGGYPFFSDGFIVRVGAGHRLRGRQPMGAGNLSPVYTATYRVRAEQTPPVQRRQSPSISANVPSCVQPDGQLVISATASGGTAFRAEGVWVKDGLQRRTELLVNGTRVDDRWSSESVWDYRAGGDRTVGGSETVSSTINLTNYSQSTISITVKSTLYWNGYYHVPEQYLGHTPIDVLERTFTIRVAGPDVNKSGCVDDADLLQVLFAFGTNNVEADVDCSGVVDDADLLKVLFAFGQGC